MHTRDTTRMNTEHFERICDKLQKVIKQKQEIATFEHLTKYEQRKYRTEVAGMLKALAFLHAEQATPEYRPDLVTP